jgi:VanZ family protein
MPTERPAPPGGRAAAARVLCLVAASVIVLELFTMSLRPAAAGLIAAPWDKVAHFTVYAAIAALLWIAAGARMPLLVIAATIAIGALDELHQVGIPGRSADAMDFLADTCAVAATVAVLAIKTRQKASPVGGKSCAA